MRVNKESYRCVVKNELKEVSFSVFLLAWGCFIGGCYGVRLEHASYARGCVCWNGEGVRFRGAFTTYVKSRKMVSDSQIELF
jgi:hypothetical protein